MDWPEDAHTEGASPAALAVAKVWLDKMHSEVTGRGEEWFMPQIFAVLGAVMFVWWRKHKNLDVWVSDTEAAYHNNFMQNGNAVTEAERRELWHWLLSL